MRRTYIFFGTIVGVFFIGLAFITGIDQPPITHNPSYTDAVLLHAYWLSQKDNGPVALSLRSELEVKAAYLLYKNNLANYFVITGGPIWGPRYPSIGRIMYQELIKLGVPQNMIILQDTAMDTYEEIAVSLDIVNQHHWHNIADLAARQHDKVIPHLFTAQHAQATYITAEDVLQQYGTEQDKETINKLNQSIYDLGLGVYEDMVRLTLFVDPHYVLLGKQAHAIRTHKTPYGGIFFLPVDIYNI